MKLNYDYDTVLVNKNLNLEQDILSCFPLQHFVDLARLQRERERVYLETRYLKIRGVVDRGMANTNTNKIEYIL